MEPEHEPLEEPKVTTQKFMLHVMVWGDEMRFDPFRVELSKPAESDAWGFLFAIFV